MYWLIILVMLFLGSGLVCHFLARRRGANAVLWGTLGGVFGPLAIPFAFFARPRKQG